MNKGEKRLIVIDLLSRENSYLCANQITERIREENKINISAREVAQIIRTIPVYKKNFGDHYSRDRYHALSYKIKNV